MASIFLKIISGEIPSFKIAETNNCYAFLDINPVKRGHTLVIPKTEVDNLFDLEEKLYAELWLFSKHISKAIKNSVPCKRIGVAVVGFEVPHAHIHLIPINKISDLSFEHPKKVLSQMEFQKIAKDISQKYLDQASI